MAPLLYRTRFSLFSDQAIVTSVELHFTLFLTSWLTSQLVHWFLQSLMSDALGQLTFELLDVDLPTGSVRKQVEKSALQRLYFFTLGGQLA